MCKLLRPIAILLPLSSIFVSQALGQQAANALARNSKGANHILVKMESEPPPPRTPQIILAGLIDAEIKVREELNRHTFKRDVVLQTIGPNGQVTGEYIRNSQFVLDDRGNRIERVLYHPKSTIREMRITREDIQDLGSAQLLGVDIAETGKYNLSFAGREVVKSRELFVVNVTPAQNPDPHKMSRRFFIGRVWIDATSLHILRVKGVVEPQGKQRFPVFETLRDSVGGSPLFPVRTEADDVLRFPQRDVHYRIKVRYYDYKRFASKVSILELDAPPSNERK
jgi:hypothetical protein